MRKEISDSFSALSIGAVNAAVRPYHQTVEVIHEPRIARFRSSDCQVRGCASLNPAGFAHFFAIEGAKRGMVKHREKFLEALPGSFALVDESIGRHETKVAGFNARSVKP